VSPGSILDAEAGRRHRFTVIHRDRVPNAYPRQMRELAVWSRVFDAEGLAPVVGGASAGNLSFRTPAGFVITPTRTLLKTELPWTSLVEVVRCDLERFQVHVLGERAPSSDTLLHDRIYACRPDVAAVFHGHDDRILARARDLAGSFPIAVGAARPFGTLDDAAHTARELGSLEGIIRLGHGFVTVGRSQVRAGELAVALHRAAVAAP
jgi:ribulose-5-phosphate 4-epimerase/fuculose-1-phosphate aldolase